ncbi:UxaA family hydrolase [Aliiruegeria haliotis]|uniref:UxaA family hydrolase n=1 Tax=Aliiruegeria haliotis TaxID=1280846 RepID=UPI0013049F8F|nr:UxaA family hydrolase [Aliiruegeria haliotis]
MTNDADNIGVSKRSAAAGSIQQVGTRQVTLETTVGMGHKVALAPIREGQDVMKYGFPIGVATCDIAPGAHVHLHNSASRYTVIRDRESEK